MKWKILGCIASLITVVCLALIGALFVSDGGDVQQYKKNRNNDKMDQIETNIDWKALKKRNPNVYAWIEVPGTKIDYPVLQPSADQEKNFYLQHNIDDQYSFAGSIYSQKENAKDFGDPVTVLYGHNMINESMFGTLRKFDDPDFFDRHSLFYIYMPGQKLTYKILSYQIGSDDHLLDTYHPNQAEGFQKFMKAITEKENRIRKGIEVTQAMRIVTLSTCSPREKKRRLLHGVLIHTKKEK